MLDDGVLRRFVPHDRRSERIARCVFGLVLFGIGVAVLLRAELGAAPWDVFHSGVSELTGISVGPIIIGTGVLLLVIWIPLHERAGLGTILNALLIGVFVDLTMPCLSDYDELVVRVPMMIGGIVLIAIGSGFYIGAGLGPGPRDGLMTGLSKRSVGRYAISTRAARTLVEIVALSIGVALGGAIGVGTAAFALGIGPLVQIFLPRLTLPTPDLAPARRDTLPQL